MAGQLLTPGQQRFTGALSKETGLDPRVIGAWALAEQSGGAARGYEGRGYNNWLNIANTDSGPAGGAHSQVWRDPLQAARATAEWLRGQGPIAREYGKPAGGIQAILRAGRDPMAQINAIARSGWASSGYNGGSDLRSLYGQLAGLQVPSQALGGGGGTAGVPGLPARSGAGPGGGVERSPAQVEDLMALVDALKPSGPSTSVEGLAVPKPSSGEGPRLPQEVAQEPGPSPADLLRLISKIGEDASTAQPPSAAGLPARPGIPGSSGEGGGTGSGGYVNPLPGFHLSRTDMGVDASAAPGTPIRAMGNAKILGIQPNWYAGQPYLYYELLDGPRKGQVQYVAEQIAPTVKAGDVVRAGQTIGHYASSGTGIETGIGTRGWQTLAQSEGRTGDSTHGNAPAGIRERRILEALGAR